MLLEFTIEFLPLLIKVLPIVVVLLYLELLLLLRVHPESFFESEGINLFQDSFQGYQTFLQNFVPVIICQVNYHWYQHRECLVFVSFEDIEEVVIFKEAHSSVSHLQVNSSDASYNSLEQFRDEVLNFVYLAHFKYFLQFCQK
jgi:hypothetical protein